MTDSLYGLRLLVVMSVQEDVERCILGDRAHGARPDARLAPAAQA